MAMFCVATGQPPAVYHSLSLGEREAFRWAVKELNRER